MSKTGKRVVNTVHPAAALVHKMHHVTSHHAADGIEVVERHIDDLVPRLAADHLVLEACCLFHRSQLSVRATSAS